MQVPGADQGFFVPSAPRTDQGLDADASTLFRAKAPPYVFAEMLANFPAALARIDADIQDRLDAAVERALAADDPTPDQLYTDVYVSYRGEPA